MTSLKRNRNLIAQCWRQKSQTKTVRSLNNVCSAILVLYNLNPQVNVYNFFQTSFALYCFKMIFLITSISNLFIKAKNIDP